MEENEKEVSLYEVGYLLEPQVAEEILPVEVAKLTNIVSEHRGEIVLSDNPHLRNLAYRIEKFVGGKRVKYTQGYFGWIKFNAPASSLLEIAQGISKSQTVLRSLVIHSVKSSHRSLFRRASVQRASSETQDKPSEAEIDLEVEKLIAQIVPA